MQDKHAIDWAIFKVVPDFEVIRKYINLGSTNKDFKKFVNEYKRNGSFVELPFMSLEQEDLLAIEYIQVLDKYRLHEHSSNIFYLLLVLLKYSHTVMTEYRIPAMNNEKKVESIKELINFLLECGDNDLKLTIESKKVLKHHSNSKLKSKKDDIEKKVLTIDEKYVTSWVSETMLNSAMNWRYPKGYPLLLWNSALVCSLSERRQYLKLSPEAYCEFSDEQTIKTDAIMWISVPLLNYLQNQTVIQKGKAKHWSSSQLAVVIDFLIIINYYKSIRRTYNIAESNTPIEDKRYLDSTLRNKATQGKVLLSNAIKTT